jgi:perosamine synthetase
MSANGMNEYPLLNENEGIPLFYPQVPKEAISEVADTLSGRWIGQGPKVELFEKKFKELFLGNHEPLAVGSGTDAVHIAYLLAGIQKDDDVIVPSFTCTATSIPLLYIGANPILADIDPETMNISIPDVEKRITKKTKAIVCVDYGGVPNDYKALNEMCEKYELKLISDAAHSLGTKYNNTYSAQLADFTIFSFQAIKTLTTGDGGLLAIKDNSLVDKGKKLRWFGIDRAAKQGGIWENDIVDIGYKYQMNDIAAAIGLAGLKEIGEIIEYRNSLFKAYEKHLTSPRVRIVGKSSTTTYFNSSWLCTIIVDKDRIGLMKKLRDNGIESAQVHYRNDRYKIFGERRLDLPNMDFVENNYLVLPIHTKIGNDHIIRISELINEGW